MNIALIQIRNILGIKSLDVKPGMVTMIEGANGSGKTSTLSAIRAALGAGDFPAAQLIHQGEESGEIVLVLDDGTTVTRRIKQDGSDVKVLDKEGNKYAKPQSVLDSLFAVTQVNPMKLLQTDKKSRDERTRVVLESLPLEISREKILELTPSLASQIPNIDIARHGLAVLDDIEKRVFERRTDVNRDFKKVGLSILTMKEALPPEEGEKVDPVLRLTELRNKKEALDKKREAYITEFEVTRRTARENAINKYEEQMRQAEEVRAEAMRIANEAYEHARQASTEIKDRALQEAEATFERERSAKQAAYEDRMTPITAEMGRLEEQSRNAAAIEAQRSILADMEQESLALATLSDKLTAEIEAVRNYRNKSTASFPIKGLAITDGEVFYQDLAFDQLNTAKRIELAVALAAHKAGQLGVICVDGCEALDAKTFSLLEETCTKANLQMICTRVTDAPLSVNVLEAA